MVKLFTLRKLWHEIYLHFIEKLTQTLQ